DGGMSDNIRTALYDASYLCALASRASDAPPMLSRVVGRHCESGDIVVRRGPPDRPPRDPRRPAQPGLRMNRTLPTLKVALLGCGVVGTDVARLLTEQ